MAIKTIYYPLSGKWAVKSGWYYLHRDNTTGIITRDILFFGRIYATILNSESDAIKLANQYKEQKNKKLQIVKHV